MKRMALVVIITAVLGALSCKQDADLGDDPPVHHSPVTTPKPEIPNELVGVWQHGSIDFALWEKYKEGYYSGRNAAPTREAMIIGKNGDAKFYRYEMASGLYEELIDCEGTVTFGEGTFTFTPVKGRKRFYDSRNRINNKDRALTSTELKDPRLAGKRRYSFVTTSNPVALQITVPGSAPYNWYKKQ